MRGATRCGGYLGVLSSCLAFAKSENGLSQLAGCVLWREGRRDSNTGGVNKDGVVVIRTDVDTWSGSTNARMLLERRTKLVAGFDPGSKSGQLLDNMQQPKACLLPEPLGADGFSQKHG